MTRPICRWSFASESAQGFIQIAAPHGVEVGPAAHDVARAARGLRRDEHITVQVVTQGELDHYRAELPRLLRGFDVRQRDGTFEIARRSPVPILFNNRHSSVGGQYVR